MAAVVELRVGSEVSTLQRCCFDDMVRLAAVAGVAQLSRAMPATLYVGGMSLAVWTESQWDAALGLRASLRQSIVVHLPVLPSTDSHQEEQRAPAPARQASNTERQRPSAVAPTTARRTEQPLASASTAAAPARHHQPPQQAAAAAPSVAPRAHAARPPPRSVVSGDLKGQTMAVVLEFNPPVVYIAGDNTDDVRSIIYDAVMGQLSGPSKRALKRVPELVPVRPQVQEPVYELRLPQIMLTDMQQMAVVLGVLDAMERSPMWRPHVGDASVEVEESLAATHAKNQLHMLRTAGGSKGLGLPPDNDFKVYHRLFFIHR